MHELMDGFSVKSIRIYSYPRCCVSLERGQKLAIMGNMHLVDVTDGWTVLFESAVASAISFTTSILLMVNLHAFSFSKKARTFSTICLVYDLNLVPFLPGVRATFCSSELQ